MSYRVIQWATGNVGRAAIEGVLDHPDLELAGCWVHGEAKEGQDVGALIGRDPIGITATRDIDAAARTRRRLRRLQPDLRRRGHRDPDPRVGHEPRDTVRLVLPSHRGAGRPRRRVPRRRCDAARDRHPSGRHHRALPAHGLRPVVVHHRVRAEEFSDIRTYGAPDVIRDWMLFGRTPEESRQSIMAEALGAGFRQSVHMVADELGFDLDPAPAHDARDGGGDRADRVAHRADPARAGGGAALPLGRPGRRRARRHRSGELADGRGAPRPALALWPRRRALRGRGHRRPRLPGVVPQAAPRLHRVRARAKPRHRGHGDALRQRRALRVPRPSPGCAPTSRCRWWPDAPPAPLRRGRSRG